MSFSRGVLLVQNGATRARDSPLSSSRRWSLHVGLGTERASSSGAELQQYRAAVLSPGD